MKFLLVDGTNVVIRYAFAMLPDLIADPHWRATNADIERVMTAVERALRECAKQTGCTHAIICLDSPGESFRKKILPGYKSGRNTVTATWVVWLDQWLTKRGWYVASYEGAEADDVIATLSARLTNAAHEHAILSGDSDLLALVETNCEVWQFGRKPEPKFVKRPIGYVIDRYGCTPSRLPFYKAMVGEPGDNIPGVRGIGPKKAIKILDQAMGLYDGLAGHSFDAIAQFEQCLGVVALNAKVPLDPITPSQCVIPSNS